MPRGYDQIYIPLSSFQVRLEVAPERSADWANRQRQAGHLDGFKSACLKIAGSSASSSNCSWQRSRRPLASGDNSSSNKED